VNELPEELKKDSPESILAMLSWLTESNYRLEEQHYSPKHFGNAALIWSKWPMAFRLSRDRGRWFVNLAGSWDEAPPRSSDGSKWYWETIWNAYLIGRDEAFQPIKQVELDSAVDFFISRADEIRRSLTDDEEINSALSEIKLKIYKENFPDSL
jgi:hypothetical protein